MNSERALVLALAAIGLASRAPAQAAAPEDCTVPTGQELVNVRRLDRSIRVDLRYATPHNFTGRRLPGYDARIALLHPDAAAALARVQARLRTEGLGLKVFDAYRPVRATLAMVDWAQRSGNVWVLDQGYVARQSGHNLGITVDLTLVSRHSGQELAMGTPFDTFSDAAHTANASGAILANRMKLKDAMEAEGFANYEKEWWHYRYRGDPPPLDVPLSCFR
jgi:D-alanyl-D-alanine dipeptidase